MGRWEQKRAQWYELVTLYCELCGRIIPKSFWTTEIRGRKIIFCGPNCERLYRDYWLPQQDAQAAGIDAPAGKEPGKTR